MRTAETTVRPMTDADDLTAFGAVCPLPLVQRGYGVGILNVRPEHRCRGVGTALHAALAEVAPGITRLYTQNMESDEPILAANRRLGFVRAAGHVDVACTFG